MSEKPKLSENELQMLDTIIGHMEKENKPDVGHVVTDVGKDVAHGADSFVTNVTKGVTDIAQGNITNGLQHLAKAAPSVISAGQQVAEAGAMVASENDEIVKLIQKISDSEDNTKGLSLEDLIALRDKHKNQK